MGLRESWNPHSKWGLAALVRHLFGVDLDKGTRISNWEDVLSTAQQNYAVMDAVWPLSLSYFLQVLQKEYNAKQGMRAMIWNKGSFDDDDDDDDDEGPISNEQQVPD